MAPMPSLTGKTERAMVRALSKLLNALVQVRENTSSEVIDTAIDQASSALADLGTIYARQRAERSRRYAETGFDIDRVEEQG